MRRFQSAQGLAAWRWSAPTLAVIDNAASAAAVLREWLEGLAAKIFDADAPRLRLLLLERSADSTGLDGWWGKVMQEGSLASRGPRDLASPRTPVPLAGLGTLADRHALLTDAMALAANIKGVEPAPRPPPIGTDRAFDRRLAAEAIDTTRRSSS